jgi:pimeloyl-ACP methyl ester carboxylesterase
MTAVSTATPRKRGFLARPDGGIYHEVTGSGPAIVFAHGMGGNHLSWWQQVPVFSNRYTCITFSHRGFFPSDAPPDPAQYAGDVAALLDHLGIERSVIVAQSMGGWTAVDFALTYPDRLVAMVLASTSGPIDPKLAGPGAPALVTAWEAKAAEAHAAEARIGAHAAMGVRGATEQPALHQLYRAVDELSSSLDKAALRARIRAARTRPASDLAAIATPCLWLTGEEDCVFPSPVAPLMAAHMPNARHAEVPAAGHSAYFERAAAFNTLVTEFLAARE